jgi:hypothetical protein
MAGATVVIVNGEPLLYLDRSGRRAVTFSPTPTSAPSPGSDDGLLLVHAAAALRRLAAQRRGKYLRIETIDGEPARSSPKAPLFTQAGFTEDYKGLVLEVR